MRRALSLLLLLPAGLSGDTWNCWSVQTSGPTRVPSSTCWPPKVYAAGGSSQTQTATYSLQLFNSQAGSPAGAPVPVVVSGTAVCMTLLTLVPSSPSPSFGPISVRQTGGTLTWQTMVAGYAPIGGSVNGVYLPVVAWTSLAPSPAGATSFNAPACDCYQSDCRNAATQGQCPQTCPAVPCSPSGAPPPGLCAPGYIAQWDTTTCAYKCLQQSPILLNLSGGAEWPMTDAAHGVDLVLLPGNAPTRVSWTAPGADLYWLTLDRNDNGQVDDFTELFGNVTPQPPSADRNGFAALAVYDTNGDGVIDARDAVYGRLRLWRDANHDGISQAGELFTLPDLGITAISVEYTAAPYVDAHGNRFRYRARVDSAGGSRWAYDVFLTH